MSWTTNNLFIAHFRLEPFHPLVEEISADDVDEMEVMVPVPEEGTMMSAPEECVKNVITT